MKRILIISVVFVITMAISSVSMADSTTQIKAVKDVDIEKITFEIKPKEEPVDKVAIFPLILKVLPGLDAIGKMAFGWVADYGEKALNKYGDGYGSVYSGIYLPYKFGKESKEYTGTFRRSITFKENNGKSGIDRATVAISHLNITLQDLVTAKLAKINNATKECTIHTVLINFDAVPISVKDDVAPGNELQTNAYVFYPKEFYFIGTKGKHHDIADLKLEIQYKITTAISSNSEYKVATLEGSLFKDEIGDLKLDNLIKGQSPNAFVSSSAIIPIPQETSFFSIEVKIVEASNIQKWIKKVAKAIGKLG